jgi:hypothetical protein
MSSMSPEEPEATGPRGGFIAFLVRPTHVPVVLNLALIALLIWTIVASNIVTLDLAIIMVGVVLRGIVLDVMLDVTHRRHSQAVAAEEAQRLPFGRALIHILSHVRLPLVWVVLIYAGVICGYTDQVFHYWA